MAYAVPVSSPPALPVLSPGREALEVYGKRDTTKIIVRFRAVGNAPVMKQNFYRITAGNRFQAVIHFLRKELGWKRSDPLFTYINLAFAPAPDDIVANLFKASCATPLLLPAELTVFQLFQTEGYLIVNYSILGANRDEFLHRPTVAAHWHSFENPKDPSNSPGDSVLAGRDVVAGGTWLGITRSGRVAVLTNVREDAAPYEHSRGELASSFLLADDRLSVEEYATNLAATSQKYAGFNLLLFAPNLLSSPSPQSTTTLDASQSQPASGGTTMDALLVTNHGGGGRLIHRRLTQAECACAGISNGVDGTGGWAKVVGGTRDLQEVVDAAASEPTAQAREAALVNGILRTLSQEFGDPIAHRDDLRKTIQVPLIHLGGVPTLVGTNGQAEAIAETKRAGMYYATRLATIVLVRRDGGVLFLERDVFQLDPTSAEPPKNLSHGRPWTEDDDAGGHDRLFRFQIQT